MPGLSNLLPPVPIPRVLFILHGFTVRYLGRVVVGLVGPNLLAACV